MKPMTSIKYILVTVLASQVGFLQAQTNRVAAPTDYSKIQQHIADRNIFDPNRRPDRVFTTVTPKVRTAPQPTPNSFSLVGTMNYGEGDTAGIYAFFDGSSTQFRKAAVLNDGIAVFKIVSINKESVTLVQSTNKVVLKLGDQMRDDTKGNWKYYGQATGSYSQNDYGRSAGFGTTYDPRGRNNGRSYNSNFRTGADPNASSYNRNQRNFQRGGPNDTAGQDIPQDPQGADFGGFPDGTPMIIIPDFTAPPDAAPAE